MIPIKTGMCRVIAGVCNTHLFRPGLGVSFSFSFFFVSANVLYFSSALNFDHLEWSPFYKILDVQ